MSTARHEQSRRRVSIRMLVVDDEEPILFAIRGYFTTRACMVDCAQELEEAEALINANTYDVVIADLRLTGIHGAEGLELVSYVRERSTAKIILLTAYGGAEVQRAAYERGANAILQKPMPLSQIATLVESLMSHE